VGKGLFDLNDWMQVFKKKKSPIRADNKNLSKGQSNSRAAQLVNLATTTPLNPKVVHSQEVPVLPSSNLQERGKFKRQKIHLFHHRSSQLQFSSSSQMTVTRKARASAMGPLTSEARLQSYRSHSTWSIMPSLLSKMLCTTLMHPTTRRLTLKTTSARIGTCIPVGFQ